MIFKGINRFGDRRGAAAVCLSVLVGVSAVFAAPAASAEEKASAPAMWRIADEDSKIVLFGTFHLLPSQTAWQTEAFDKAMKSTDVTITEADVKSPEAQAKIAQLVQKHGLNPEGVTLSQTLGAKRAQKFEEVAKQYGVPMAQLETMRPWLAMLTLTQVAYMKSGFDPTKGVETVVLARAKEEGDEIGYLESAETQVLALASLDKSEMMKNLDVELEELPKFFDQTVKDLLEAWRTGDVGAIEKLVIKDLREQAPGAFQTLIVKRNRDWVGQIKTIMDGEGAHFIAVGTAHLVGEDSVIDMLAEAGFEPKRIQ